LALAQLGALVIFVVLAIAAAVTFHPKGSEGGDRGAALVCAGRPDRRSPAPFNRSAM